MVAPAALDNGLAVEVEPARFEEIVVTALDGLLSDTASQ
jgi:hypothetical protein